MASRLEKLKDLEGKLEKALVSCEYKSLAAIARQYRETLKDIEEIEGTQDDDDDIADILQQRAADGKPGAVR